jgi:hypothetical protein
MSSAPHSPSRNKRRSHAQWQNIMQQFVDSGLPASQFCKQHHLRYPNFSKWRLRLRTELPTPAANNPLSAFIELGSTAAEVETSGWHIVLKLGNGVELCLTQR